MHKNTHRDGSSRAGKRRYGQNVRSKSGSKTKKQSIHPSRFVKQATPLATSDYTSHYSFNDFAIHPILKSNVAIKGYKNPSEIQDKTIELGLKGKDIVGVANTGTGKTAAFALPILNKLLHDSTATALVMAPTRELAVQIEEQCRQFAKNSGLTGALLIGGLAMGRQVSSLRANPRIIIGTPGRIKDHVQQANLKLSNCTMVVLDEVDRMLDMGFLADVRFLLDQLPPNRQSFFFSATLNQDVKELIESFTSSAVTINVKAGDTSDNVHQDVVSYSGKPEKLDRLHDVLISEGVGKTLIFGDTKYGVERLAKELVNRGFKANALHGGKNQGQRQRALNGFKEGSVKILVATDVASRGIDISDITHVINFDVPKTYEDYSHRIGRAGRAGRTGYALTFVSSD